MSEERYVLEAVCQEHMRSVDGRLDDLEDQVKQISELVTAVKVLAANVETMGKELAKQGERLEKIEEKPAKRWDTIVTCVITGIVGILIGLISAGIIK